MPNYANTKGLKYKRYFFTVEEIIYIRAGMDSLFREFHGNEERQRIIKKIIKKLRNGNNTTKRK
jgi:hypothetical protein